MMSFFLFTLVSVFFLSVTPSLVSGQLQADFVHSIPPILQCGRPYTVKFETPQWNTFWDSTFVKVFASEANVLDGLSTSGLMVPVADRQPQTYTFTPTQSAPTEYVILSFQISSFRLRSLKNYKIQIACGVSIPLLLTPGCGLSGDVNGVIDLTASYPPESSVLLNKPIAMFEGPIAEGDAYPWYIVDSVSKARAHRHHPTGC